MLDSQLCKGPTEDCMKVQKDRTLIETFWPVIRGMNNIIWRCTYQKHPKQENNSKMTSSSIFSGTHSTHI